MLMNDSRLQQATFDIKRLLNGKYQLLGLAIIGSTGRGYNHADSDIDVTGIYARSKQQLISLDKIPEHMANGEGSIKAIEVLTWCRQLVRYKPTALELIHSSIFGKYGDDIGLIWLKLDKKLVVDSYANMARGMVKHPKISFKHLTQALYFYLLAKYINSNSDVFPPTDVHRLTTDDLSDKHDRIFEHYRVGITNADGNEVFSTVYECQDFINEYFVGWCEELMIGKDFERKPNPELQFHIERFLNKVYDLTWNTCRGDEWV